MGDHGRGAARAARAARAILLLLVLSLLNTTAWTRLMGYPRPERQTHDRTLEAERQRGIDFHAPVRSRCRVEHWAVSEDATWVSYTTSHVGAVPLEALHPPLRERWR